MELIILGSGTSVPHARRAAPAFWLDAGGSSLLLDISGAAPLRMAQEQLDWPALDAIWVSHFHLDHAGGLAPLLFGMKWATQTQSRTKPLKVYGGTGLEKLLRAFDSANEYGLFQQPFPLEVREIAPRDAFEILPGLTAQSFSTPHTPESLALRLTDGRGASLVYTSDTGYAESLAEFAAGAKLLLMECSFRRDKPVKTHLELADAMRLAQLAAPARVVLTHLYPEWDGFDIVAEARQHWPGETIEARDGLRLEI